MHVILDYGLGNTASLLKAVKAAGFEGTISRERETLTNASTIILPGVGSFRDAMERLHRLDLVGVLTDLVILRKKRFLGICLGMQLLGEAGFEDGETAGLGWIKGSVVKIPDCGQRIPHMGWNDVKILREGSLGSLTDRNFYFMHSYFFQAEERSISSVVDHGHHITATVEQDNIFGAQFHPEKSQVSGLIYLRHVLGGACSN